jgi:hypothetical protein
VDLGPPDTTQQYSAGAPGPSTTTREVVLAPHAVIRLTKLKRVRSGIRVCARTIGGSVPSARIRSGGRSRLAALGSRTRCFVLRADRAHTVQITGRDTFGHRVRASRRI